MAAPLLFGSLQVMVTSRLLTGKTPLHFYIM